MSGQDQKDFILLAAIVLSLGLISGGIALSAHRSGVQLREDDPPASPWWMLLGIPALGLSGQLIHFLGAMNSNDHLAWLADATFTGVVLAGALAEAKLGRRSFREGLLTIVIAEGKVFFAVVVLCCPFILVYFLGFFLMLLLPIPVVMVPLYTIFRWANSWAPPLGASTSRRES